jgi:hypothetical protein
MFHTEKGFFQIKGVILHITIPIIQLCQREPKAVENMQIIFEVGQSSAEHKQLKVMANDSRYHFKEYIEGRNFI